MPPVEATKAIANPTKAFFVNMITRDITLEDCILDLVDNSVDGAWRREGSRPMGLAEGADLSRYRIVIDATEKTFCVEDNCGGMTLDDAVNHAFSFGKRVTDAQDAYSIGVYGIGMKRAVFKLGKNIRISSTYVRADGQRESFAVPINVDKWLGNDTPPWDFDIEDEKPMAEDGVRVFVDDLTSGAAGSFSSPAFLQNLRRTIARDYSLHINRGLHIVLKRDYSLHINRGLHIVLNGLDVVGTRFELLQSADFAPMRLEYKDQSEAGVEVSVEIIGGVGAPPPESSEPDVEDEGEKRFGWYIVCNGRIVLAADKTAVAGWGTDDWPQWHRQYSGFIGIVLFTSADAAALPLTTTKRSVDTSSDIYRRARPRMRDVTRKWIDYTNARKQDLEEAKRVEAAAAPVPIYSVERRFSVSLPTIVARKPAERVANVNYSVPLTRLRNLAKAFGRINMAQREVGLKSFEYAYGELVEGGE